jgi:hypothetical protein
MAYPAIFSSARVMFKPEEIFAISEEISRNYAPLILAKPVGLSRRIALSTNELFEISQEISRKYTPKLNADTPKVVMMPIDPDHLFVSWNLKATETDLASRDNSTRQERILRIRPVMAENQNKNSAESWFDVSVTTSSNRKSVYIPVEYKADSYTATLGEINREQQFTVLAESKVTYNQTQNKAVFSSDNGMSSGCQFHA